MTDKVHILIVEDVPTDAELMEREIHQAGLDACSHRVETEAEFLRELREFRPALILADYRLPRFDGLQALERAQSLAPDVPFIFVTGALGEEVCIHSLRQGATDYVLKHSLSRLGPAVQRALAEAAERRKRRQAQHALRKNARKYRHLAENTSDIIYSLGRDGRLTYVSSQVNKYGYTPEDWLDTVFLDLILPEDRQHMARSMVRAFSRGEDISDEFRIRLPNGSVRWFEDRGRPQCDVSGAVASVSGALRDITQRKKTEQELFHHQEQLRALASELSFAEERERRRIAAALHDSVAQSLALTKLRLDMLSQQLDDDAVLNQIQEVKKNLETANRQVRTLTFELSPPVLYQIGVQAALEWLGEQFEQKHRIVVDCQQSGDIDALSETARILVFHCVRELLTNVAKHAHATRVHLCTTTQAEMAIVSVQDDGRGFDVNEVASHVRGRQSFGLFSIRERIRHIGGSVDVASTPGDGTSVRLRIPLDSRHRDGSSGPEAEPGRDSSAPCDATAGEKNTVHG